MKNKRIKRKLSKCLITKINVIFAKIQEKLFAVILAQKFSI